MRFPDETLLPNTPRCRPTSTFRHRCRPGGRAKGASLWLGSAARGPAIAGTTPECRSDMRLAFTPRQTAQRFRQPPHLYERLGCWRGAARHPPRRNGRCLGRRERRRAHCPELRIGLQVRHVYRRWSGTHRRARLTDAPHAGAAGAAPTAGAHRRPKRALTAIAPFVRCPRVGSTSQPRTGVSPRLNPHPRGAAPNSCLRGLPIARRRYSRARSSARRPRGDGGRRPRPRCGAAPSTPPGRVARRRRPPSRPPRTGEGPG